MTSCSTPRPTPTLKASRPSFAAPASSPSASCTRSGSALVASGSVATSRLDTVLIAAVPPVLGGLTSHSPRSQRERTRRENRRLKFYGLRDNLRRGALNRALQGHHVPES